MDLVAQPPQASSLLAYSNSISTSRVQASQYANELATNPHSNLVILPQETNDVCTQSYSQNSQMKAMSMVKAELDDAIGTGYCSDDEASDFENAEPCDSGRTRSSTRRANQSKETEKATPPKVPEKKVTPEQNKGRKRKKAGAGDGSDSDPDDNREKSRLRTESAVTKPQEDEDLIVCSCPKDVMTCIGILPSLPIVCKFARDSDDSDSSFGEDLTHTVLPRVERNRQTGEE